jgi:hypothetical protein
VAKFHKLVVLLGENLENNENSKKTLEGDYSIKN